MKTILLTFLTLLGIATCAQIPKPQKKTYINDYAHVLSEGDAVRLNKRLFALEKQKDVQLAIVLVNTIPAKYDIKTYARQIGKTWKVGKNQRGIVYVAAIQQRKQRLEVSQKLAGTFTAEKKENILTSVKPSFKTGKYSAGLAALIDGIDNELAPVAPAAQTSPEQPVASSTAAPARQADTEEDNGNLWMGFAFIGLIILLIVWFVRRANNRRRMQQQQYFNQNNPGYYNPNQPNNPNNPGGYGNQGYGNQGYGGYPPYNQPPQQNNTLRDMATGAIIGGALGYGARAMQDRASDNDHQQNNDQNANHIRPEDTPHRSGDDLPNEPSNWGNWGSGSSNDSGDYSEPSKFTDNSWGDSNDGGWGDSGGGDDGGWSDSGDSSDDGGSSDW